MEGYSRDLLRGIGGGDEQQRPPPQRLDLETEEVELSLGLSLGGRFGPDRSRLPRSSSVACIMAPEEVALAPPALARTSSLPTMADADAGDKLSLGGSNAARTNAAEVDRPAPLQGSGVAVEHPATLQGSSVAVGPVAKLPATGSPSPGSSNGEGKRHEGNSADVLARTSSLPAGIEDEWRKRKEAQTLKRLEVKRKRIQRLNSSNVSAEAVGQILEEMNATASTERVESADELSMRNKQAGENVNRSNVRRHLSGLPPTYQATVASSQGSCLPGKLKRHNSAVKGTPRAEERGLPSAVPPSSEGTNGMLPAKSANSTAIVTPSSSALAVRAAALGSRGEQQPVSGRLAARARSTGDVERMMQEMPCVCTKGLPNGRNIEGFLYKYRRAEEVRIVCVCHGSFLTPAEFVKHAGGGEVANPLRHIVVNPVAHSLS
uniref:Uncharacterized protein n=2 Tax=Avena sativa TaxID=4498 RepID=A0ACD5XDG4_AVESA